MSRYYFNGHPWPSRRGRRRGLHPLHGTPRGTRIHARRTRRGDTLLTVAGVAIIVPKEPA